MFLKSSVIFKQLYSLKVISLKRTYLLLSLSFFVILFETLSIVSLMPIIQFIQYGLDVNVFIEKTQYGEKIFYLFNFIGVSFNIFSLAVILASLVIIRQLLSYFTIIEKLLTQDSLQSLQNMSVYK